MINDDRDFFCNGISNTLNISWHGVLNKR
jgi:hypothetical protein